MPSVTSVVLQRRPVELRVGLHRVDQVRDAAGRLLDLAEQARPSRACSRPSRAPGSRRVGVRARRRPARTSRRRRRRRRARARCASRSSTPRARRASRTARPRDRRPPADRSDGRRGVDSRRSASSATNCSAVSELLGEAASDDSRASAGLPAARRRRGSPPTAGLLISWASPAASVPSATSASRCRAVDSMLRRSGRTPRSGGRRTGTTRGHARRARRRAPGAAGRRRAPGRSRGRRLVVPRPEPAGPLARACPSRRARCPRCRPAGPGSTAPSSSTHQNVGRLALAGTAPPRARSVTSVAGRGQLVSCSSSSPSNRSSAQLRDARPSRPSDRRQVAVHEVDRHRALADGRGDPLHRVEPHVTGGEDAGHAGLQGERRPRPAASAAARRPAGPGR